MLQRSEVISRIEQHLAGGLSAADLAQWAFLRFYALEMEEETVDPADAETIGAALDDLMFADEPDFGLEEGDLRRMIEALQRP